MKRYYLAFIALTGICFLFFLPQILGREVFYCCDNLLINIPAKQFWKEEVLQGRIPTWNPYLFSGVPFLADMNVATFSPFNVLYLFLSPFAAITQGILLSFLISLVGMVALALLLGMMPLSAMAAALIFSFSGTMVVYTGNVPMLHGASLLPWVFASWLFYIKHPKGIYAAGISVLMAIQFFSGHPQLTLYSYVVCFLFGLIYLPGTLSSKLKHIGLIATLTICLIGIQLVPFVEFAFSSTRQMMGNSMKDVGALPISAVVRLLIPSIVGNIGKGTDWWQGGSVYGYVGVLSLVLATFGIRQKRYGTFFGSIALVTFLAAFGEKSPVFWILKHTVPGVAQFRVPSNFLLLTTFSIALLAGWGLENIRHISRSITIQRLLCVCAIFVSLVGVFFLFFSAPIAEFIFTHSFFSFASRKLDFLGAGGVGNLISSIGINFLLLSVQGFCISWFFIKRFSLRVQWIVIVLLCVDLFLYSRSAILTQPKNTVEAWSQTATVLTQEIKKHTSDEYRSMFDPVLYAAPKQRVYGEVSFIPETEWQVRSLRPNLVAQSKLAIVNGYGSTIYSPYQAFFKTLPQDPTGIIIPDVHSLEAKEIGLRYVVSSPNNVRAFTSTRTYPISTDITLYELPDALPNVRFVSSSGNVAQVEYLSDHPQEISVRVNATESGQVIFATINYPGWKATVNQVPSEIIPYQSILQSVPVNPGITVVRFWYESMSVKIGMWMTGIGLMSILFLCVKEVYKRKR